MAACLGCWQRQTVTQYIQRKIAHTIEDVYNECRRQEGPVNILEAPGDRSDRHSALCEVPDACWLKRLLPLSTGAFSRRRATFVLAGVVQTNVQSPWRQSGLSSHSLSATLHTSDRLDAHFPLERAKPSEHHGDLLGGATPLGAAEPLGRQWPTTHGEHLTAFNNSRHNAKFIKCD